MAQSTMTTMTPVPSLNLLPNNPLDIKSPITMSANPFSVEYPFEADTIGTALHVIDTERDALSNLTYIYRTNDAARRSLAETVSIIAKVQENGGRLIITGVGKSGKIAEKCVSTMNSLGIRSASLHPVEALHGDLGMIGPLGFASSDDHAQADAMLIITFSGRTPELLSMVSHLPTQMPRLVISSHMDTATCPLISRQPHGNWILLPAPIPISEIKSFGLAAPTTSTTVALALTDALALAVARTLHTDAATGPIKEIREGPERDLTATTSEQRSSMGDGADVMLRPSVNAAPSKDGIAKLNQIVQNYFTKAALVILNARVALPPAYGKDSRTRRVNKWFNVEVDETDLTRDDLRTWKSCDSIDDRPPPMVIETYVDAQELTNNQNLVFIENDGKRWDVEEAFNASSSSSPGGSREARPEVIVERWVVQLGKAPDEMPENLGVILPRTYKNSIVLFRSLYTCARLLPAWKFGKRMFTSRSSANTPRLRYRIAQEPTLDEGSRRDSLSFPLYQGHDEVIENHAFDPIESAAGPFSIHVTYRTSCDFRIDDSETLLSSRFLGMDEPFLERPSARRLESAPTHSHCTKGAAELGSLPQQRQSRPSLADQGQAYGSMSTFHRIGPPVGTSPLSALRAARTAVSESPEDSMPKKAPPNSRSAQGSRSSLRSADGNTGVARRPSVSFMPFKTPSLSASPSQGEQMMSSIPRGSSLGKSSPLAVLAEARRPSGLPPSRGSPVGPDQTNPSSLSNSSKPAAPTRYSSSFGHRKAKLSTGGSSRTEDDNSSGKASATSSAAQPGSGVLAEGGTSSGSIQTDDDNISEFLRMLDQKKDLKSFRSSRDQAASEASTRRTSAALTKFQRMRDSNAALSESLSSLMLHRSSSSSSRQLASVPAMIAGTSISTSSSPGKPISPHTPHTPAIPSRLSANSIAEYARPSSSDRRRERSATAEEPSQEDEEPTLGAIDIPTSPRPFNPSYRRSSSAAQGPRAAPLEDDDIFPFVMRSASLGMEDRQPLNLSTLADLHGEPTRDESAVVIPSVDNRPAFGPLFSHAERGGEAMHQRSSEDHGKSGVLAARGAHYRPYLGRRAGRGESSTQGSSSSLIDRGSGSGSSDQRGGPYSFFRPQSTFEDDEPLLFAFDPLQQSRRSREDLQGSSQAGEDSAGSSKRGTPNAPTTFTSTCPPVTLSFSNYFFIFSYFFFYVPSEASSIVHFPLETAQHFGNKIERAPAHLTLGFPIYDYNHVDKVSDSTSVARSTSHPPHRFPPSAFKNAVTHRGYSEACPFGATGSIFRCSIFHLMSSLLWKYYFENDVEQFRYTLGRISHITPQPSRGKGGSNALSSSPGAALATSPILTKSRKLSTHHAHAISSSGSLRSDANVSLSRGNINWKDAHGVTLLHLIASSTAPNASEFALALIDSSLLDLCAQDDESGWTALHRALYFGNITIARALMNRDILDSMQFSTPGAAYTAGGLFKIKDREGYSPFDVYGASIANRIIRQSGSIHLLGGSSNDEDDEMAQGVSDDANDNDKHKLVTPRTHIDGDEIFAFGSNKNFTLGFGDEDDRQFPERVYVKRPDHLLYRFFEEHKVSTQPRLRRLPDEATSLPFGIFELPAIVRYRPIAIQDVQLSKLHSAVLTTDPEANLYMCGFGSGGRLGTGDETTRFSYVSIHGGGLAGKRVAHIALGQNHTIAISSEGETFTWGSNPFGQLGYTTNVSGPSLKDEKALQLLPRQVFGPLKREIVVGAAASRTHSAVHTSTSLYTFGKNEGQMGLVDSDARSLISQNTPRRVGASLFSSTIHTITAIDKATICLLDDHEVWVFANYGYTRVSFPVEKFSNYFLHEHSNAGRREATRQTVGGNEICKITSGGDTICAMTSTGDVFTMHVSQNMETSTLSSSTTNPSKIRGALSAPQRVWSLKKSHMAVKDVDVGQDGSIIICTASGSVWRRIQRAKIKDGTTAGLPEYKVKDYKFSRVPGLTRITAVRSNTFGAYAAVRRDCDVLQTQVDVEATTLWKDLYPLLPFHSFGAEDSDTENPSPRFWTPSQPNDVATIRRAVLTGSDIEGDMASFLRDQITSCYGTFDFQVATTVSHVRIPVHAFMLTGRSPILEKGLTEFRKAYFFSIPNVMCIEYDNDGRPVVVFQGVDFITILNLILYIYTDSVVDVWQHTRRAPEMAFRYRQIRSELMKVASSLELRRLEHAVRLMAEPPKTLHEDMGLAIQRQSYFDNGDVEVMLNGSSQNVHGALVCQRCPFFHGLFQGRAAGRWLSRRGQEPEDPMKIDLTHVDPSVFRFIVRHMYADVDERMFDDIVTADLDSYLDLIIEVMSVANELMLDRLAQCCQKTLGRYVNARNVCQLLNAVAPCSVGEFKDAALEYLCLNLEGMLENHLLDELDDDLMLELDEVVRQNQLNCLPIAKSGRTEADLYERYPSLIGLVERGKAIKADQVSLQSKIRERESKIGGTPKAKGNLLEDFETSPLTRKSPRQLPIDSNSQSKSPSLKPKRSAVDLMFEMEESEDSDGEEGTKHLPSASRRSSKAHQTHLTPAMPYKDDACGQSAETGEAASPSASYQASEGVQPKTFDSSLGAKSSSGKHQPWATPSMITSKLDMKDIMAQASCNRTSNISSALAMRVKESKSPNLPAKLSQRERKKQQQQLQAHLTVAPELTSNATPIVETQAGSSDKSASPWRKASTGPVVSLKDVLGAEESSPSAKKEEAIPRTPSPMTLRQTIAGKPAARRAISGPAQPTIIPSRRTISSPSSSKTTGQKVLEPPRSISTYNPPIRSFGHVSTPAIEPSLQLSMSDILSQQQTEKEIIKEAIAKRSLQEIQEEQAFQEWWDQESRKVQEEQEAAAKSPSGRGSKTERGKGRVSSRGRGRGIERGGKGGGEGSSVAVAAGDKASSGKHKVKGK
ncbi:MAG: hypothetical protein Q9217_001635 [Psora testacea]